MLKRIDFSRSMMITTVVFLFTAGFVTEAKAQIQPIRSIRHPFNDTWIKCVEFSPDGTMIATANAGAKIWDVATGELLRTVHQEGNYVQSLAFSPDGRYLVTGDWEAMVQIWDVKTGERIQSIKFLPPEEPHVVPWMFVYAVTFSPDGRSVLANCENLTALFDVSTGVEMHRFYAGEKYLAFFPDGKSFLTQGGDSNGSVGWIVDIATGAIIRTFRGVAVLSPDGSRICTSTQENDITILHSQTQDVLCTFRSDRSFTGVDFSPDGRRLLVGAQVGHYWSGYTYSTDLVGVEGSEMGKILRTFSSNTSTPTYHVSYSPDGKTVATVVGNTAYLYDISDLAAGVKDEAQVYDKQE